MGIKSQRLLWACLSLGLCHLAPSVAQTQVPVLALSSSTSQHLVQVAAQRLNVHAQPDDKAEVIGHVVRGEMLTVVEERANWLGVAISSTTERKGWVQQTWLQAEGQLALQSLMGPGPALMAEDFTGVPAPETDLSRPVSVQRVVTLPPADPRQIGAPDVRLPRESIPLPDRWRLMQALGFKFPWYDPYHQNVYKGDLPWPNAPINDLFVNIGVVSDNLLEHRSSPTPVAGGISIRPGTQDIFGGRTQSVQAHTLLLSLSLTKGNTTFKPPDWEFRISQALQYNRARVQEAGALTVDPSTGSRRTDHFVGTQELYADYHLRNVSSRFDFDSLRVGVQPFTSDFRGFIFNDLPAGIRLFGNRDNNQYQYNLGVFKRVQKDTNSGLNDLSRQLRNDDVLVANLYRQDFPIPGFTSQWTAIHNRNREHTPYYDNNGFLVRPAYLGDLRGHDYNVTYLGYSGDGHLGWLLDIWRLNLSTSTYWVVGHDSYSPIAQKPQSINAWFHATEVSRDFSWARARVHWMLTSGDKDPYDHRATGFDAIQENPQFAGADSSYFMRQGLPLIGGGGVALSGRNGLIPSLRSSKDEGQSNFQNPGLSLLGTGVDIDVMPELRLLANVSHLRFNQTSMLSALRNENIRSRDIGMDYSVGFQYRPYYNQHIVLTGSLAVLKFGAGLTQLYGGAQDRLHSLVFNALLAY
jgi:uncharacterized protein YgiM (DUF1202 family)